MANLHDATGPSDETSGPSIAQGRARSVYVATADEQAWVRALGEHVVAGVLRMPRNTIVRIGGGFGVRAGTLELFRARRAALPPSGVPNAVVGRVDDAAVLPSPRPSVAPAAPPASGSAA